MLKLLKQMGRSNGNALKSVVSWPSAHTGTYANSRTNAQKLPKDLPLLIISGEMDPVGDMGKGVRKVYQLYTGAGIADVTLKLIPGARHELLNETNKKEVYRILADWLEAHI